MLQDLIIPRPPVSTNLAFCKHTGECLGMVVEAIDARWRSIPEWLTKSIERYMVWDGIFIGYYTANSVTLEWKMD